MSDHIDDLLPEALLEPLPAAEQARLDAHLLACEPCRALVRASRESLASLALALPSPEPDDSLRANILAGLDARPPYEGFVRRFARLFELSEAAARQVLLDSADPSGWASFLPGVSAFPFEPGPSLRTANAAVVRVEAAATYPHHTHHGDEIMFILAGLLRDDASGVVSSPGDMIHQGPRSAHSFTIPEGEPCISAVLLFGGPPLFTN